MSLPYEHGCDLSIKEGKLIDNTFCFVKMLSVIRQPQQNTLAASGLLSTIEEQGMWEAGGRGSPPKPPHYKGVGLIRKHNQIVICCSNAIQLNQNGNAVSRNTVHAKQ